MEEYTSILAYNNERGCVVTIGTFDGVHMGHSAILDRLVNSAKEKNLDSVLLTFFPHPRMVLQKDSDIKLINTLSEKKNLLESLGVDHMIVHEFTHEFSRMTALEYVRDILVNKLNAKKIIIGYDHRFGRNRTANIENLKEFGQTYGFLVEEISAKELDNVAVSSTKVRRALEEGEIRIANRFLNYQYMLSGTIVKGKGIGKTLGFPTANLEVKESYKLIPKNGVYLTQCLLNNNLIYGLTNIGTNPTIGDNKITIETYFLDINQDLYDKNITLEFISRIRNEQTFDSLEQLKSAILKDEQSARQYLANNE